VPEPCAARPRSINGARTWSRDCRGEPKGGGRSADGKVTTCVLGCIHWSGWFRDRDERDIFFRVFAHDALAQLLMPEPFMTDSFAKPINRRRPFAGFAATLIAALFTIQCSSSGSPTAATNGRSEVASVTLNTSTLAAGSTTQGTVALAAAAPAGGANVALTSSNSAVATVQNSIAIAAGSTSAAFTVTAVAAGTATITATLNGSSGQSPALTVTRGAALASLTLSAPTVVGGSTVNATATLTAAAPAGGAVVSLSSADPVTVPPSVTVPAGATTTAFTILTRVVGGTIAATITGSYGGASASAALSVTRPTTATASFGVTGPHETETCVVADNGNAIDCTFDGSTSTAPATIVAWDWTYGRATLRAQTTTDPKLTRPAFSCSMLPPPPLPADGTPLTMTVTLKIHDDAGNVSAVATDTGVRVLPQGSCGY